MKTQATAKEKSKTGFNMPNNSVLLRRKNTLYTNPDVFHNPNHITAMNLNIASLGYTLSPELFKLLQTKSVEDIAGINNFLVKTLSEMVGANVRYRPMFRNFPKDVPDAYEHLFERIYAWVESSLGLTENAKLLSCGHLIDTEQFDMSNHSGCPICQRTLNDDEILPSKERKPFKGKVKLKVIGLGSEKDVFAIFTNILSSTTSISQSDKDDVLSIFMYNNKEKIEKSFPDIIPHKEVLAFVAKLVIEHLPVYELIEKSIKTATDVLRIATSLSDGDISLAENTKYKKFSKTERKFLLYLLENSTGAIEEDMLRYSGKWIRLGEILHPREYQKKFPKAAEAFRKLRNGIKIETFNSKSESLISDEKFKYLVIHLKARPSELARKLDMIVSKSTDAVVKIALTAFERGIGDISTPVLLQVLGNFRVRASEDKTIRMIMPKGNVAKMQVLDETREPMKKSVSKKVVELVNAELLRRFAELPEMGKVYIDENLKNYVVPFSQRSASKSLVTVTRGSHITLPKEDTIRMFVYWHESGKGRIDVDLSAVILDEDFKYKEHISYTNYHGRDGYKATHSGDLQSGEHGAAEFIDIDVPSLEKYGARYVCMNVYSFTGQSFDSDAFKDCFAGFMARQKHKSGEIFEPKTVKQRFDITSKATVCIPLMIDVVEKKVIWADLSMRGRRGGGNNIEYHSENTSKIVRAMAEMNKHKANIYELLYLHAKARGKVVKDAEKADVVFDETNIPFEIDKLVGEYLV